MSMSTASDRRTGWLASALPRASSWLVLGAALWACAGKDPDPIVSTVDGGGQGVDAGDAGTAYVPFVPVCEEGNRFCGDGGSAPLTPTCGDPVTLTPSGVNVMIALDGSYAMRAHWSVVQNAVKRLVENNPTLDYGAHLFWANPDFEGAIDRVNVCNTAENRLLDVAPGQQTAVLPFLGPKPPGPGGRWFSLRPVIQPLNYYLENDTKLADPTRTNYLVFISNGDDNCFGTALAGDGDKLLTYEKLGIELVKKNIRVMPIGFDGATAQRTWDGKLKTDFAALDALAKNGGTGLDAALAADSSEQLEEAINRVSQSVRTCRFKIPDALDPTKALNPFQLVFTVNGVELSRDRTERDGWNFVSGNTDEVEIFGDACTAIQAGKAADARRGCNDDAVCGKAATRVSTKPRVVQYLFDRSLSMINCPEGSDCLFGGDLIWWGLATRSVAKSLVSTVNDDAEFGMQYFPASAPGFGSCDVADAPEVPPSESAEISIIGSMLSTAPLGSTPLVAALEGLAAAPGRVGEEGVTGAVILLSDGGNSCAGLTTEESVARLEAAAKALHDRGVRVYVIRFGAKDSTFADQDAQLRAIAIAGGTATGDPTDPANIPYLDAPDEDALNGVLSSVSESLAACELALGDVPDDADKTKVNLYINGSVVPFDSTDAKADGWGFSDDAKTVITLYGPACTEFKNNRATSLVVEFGCVPEILR
jgi:hypothetical protein